MNQFYSHDLEFFAISNGKGAIDCIDGSIKRYVEYGENMSGGNHVRSCPMSFNNPALLSYISEEDIVSHWSHLESFVENARNV